MRFDYTFKHYSPYNTVDIAGFKHAFGLLAQFVNPMHIQYYFDLQNYEQIDRQNMSKASHTHTAAKQTAQEKFHQTCKMALMAQGKEYSLQIQWPKMREFLEYYQTEYLQKKNK